MGALNGFASTRCPRWREGVARLRRGVAGGLVLALVWSLLWGGWHRALHGDPLAHARASAYATVHALAHGLAPASSHETADHDATGHEAGSEDCRLLDQLLLVDALVSVPTLVADVPGHTAACKSVDPAAVATAALRAYQARAPPRA